MPSTPAIASSIGVATATPGPGTRDYKVLAERLIAEEDAALKRSAEAVKELCAVIGV